MKSVIEEIFIGKRGHCQAIKLSDEYKKMQHDENQMIASFIKGLTEEQKKAFDEICNLQSDMEFAIIFQYYKEGFETGFLIAAECLTE